MVVFTEHMKSFEMPTKQHFLNCALLGLRDAPYTPKHRETQGNFLFTFFKFVRAVMQFAPGKKNTKYISLVIIM